MQTGHWLIIANPNASGVGQLTLDSLEKTCSRLLTGVCSGYQVFVPESPEHLHAALQDKLCRESVSAVIVAGGDGTLSEILPVMVQHTTVPVGILPLGTGNLLAMNLGIPLEIEGALRVILGGKTVSADLARMNDHLFILNASIGIDAEIMEKTERTLKQKWGLLAYVIRGLPLLQKAKTARLRIIADGRLIKARAMGVTISNAGSKILGGLTLTPNVRIDDGYLHATIFRRKTVWDVWLSILLLFLPFARKWPGPITDFSARKILIESRPALKMQADGTVIEETPATVEILEEKLLIFVPT